MQRILLFLSLITFLFSNPVVTENDPSTLVNGVSVITGDFYTFDEDFVIAGTEPIRLHRGYLSSVGDWNPQTHYTAEFHFGDLFIVPEANGTIIEYRPLKKQKKHGPLRYNSVLYYSPGVTNTASGKISALTNYQNQYLTVESDQSIVIHAANGTKRHYRAIANQTREYTGISYEYIRYDYQLRSEELPNGNIIEYSWDKQNHLRSITSKSPRGKEYAKLTIPEWDENHPPKGMQKFGSDQQVIGYEYSYLDRKKKRQWMLTAIEPPDQPKRHFIHDLKKLGSGRDKEKVPCLEKISFPSGREISIEYEEYKNKYGDSHYRVKKLKAPIGADEKLLVSHTFSYFPEERYSYVLDAKNNKTVYFWNQDQRLIRIDYYEGIDQLHHVEKFAWEGPFLKCKSYFDSNEKAIWARAFEYDERGNVLVETFVGQLTGDGSDLQIDERGFYIENPLLNKCIKKTAYTKDGRNLPERQEEPSGLVTLFEYYPNTNLLKKKILCDHNDETVTATYYYEYNEDLILVRTITDDGLACTISQITPKAFQPYYGMPEIIEEKYRLGDQEILLSKIALHYGAGGRIEKKDIYDANNTLRYTLAFTYNHKGLLEQETNPLGWQTIYKYDAAYNRSYVKETSGLETFYSYDFSNRLTRKEEVGSDQIHNIHTYTYDETHNLTSETDSKQHATHYKKITLQGKRQETHLPPIPNEQGTLITPTLKASFDSMGNETAFTDAEGFSTNTTYNAYGKPLQIEYPDGAKESWTYYLDGTIHTHTDPIGLLTTYTRDYLGRPTCKTISYKEKTLAEEKYEYHGFHLISKTDAEENRTTFSYDRAGRKIQETTHNDTITFQYDEFSRNHKIEHSSVRTVHQYDLLGRIEETRDEDIATNHFLRKIVHHYDSIGNTTATFRWIHDNHTQTCERFDYDSQNRLISKLDPSSHLETIAYNDNYTNQHQQRVLQKTHTDPMGLKTIDTFDTHGHIVKTEKTHNQQTISLEEKTTNARGQTSLQINIADMPDGNTRTTRTRWEYDAMGRVTKLIEAAQTPLAKITSHTYTLRGEKKTTTKPNGVILTYSYDPLGSLEQIHSSDQTVNHQMRHNRLGHLVWHDGIERKVDHKGRLLEEKFPSYTLQNHYNAMGLRDKCTCKEANFHIDYAYYGKDMTHVTRKTFDEKELYTHQYLHYDLSGNLLSAILPSNLGQITYRYDLESRQESIESPYYSQAILETDKLGNPLHLLTQKEHSFFTYDSLYQLTSESGLFNHTYQYDSLYARHAKDQEQYQINALNQISNTTYDQNGNPIQQGQTLYTWDALDRLIQIQAPDSIQQFTYDSLHRRLTVAINQETTHFIYDGQNEIGAFDTNLQLQNLRILGSAPHAEIGASVALELHNRIYIPIHDLSGNIATLIPLDGNDIEQTRYSAFGEETGSRLSPWRFSSKRMEEKTNLVYYGRRFYQPELGRWLSPDPAGFTDGMNLYAFVHNSPLNHFDEYGLFLISAPSWLHESQQLQRFEKDRSPIARPIFNTALGIWNSPRFQGSMQAIGGLAEAGIGGGVTLASAGFAVLAGGAVMAHGLDHFFTGITIASSGRPRETLTSQLLQKTGMPRQAATFVDNSFSMAGMGLGAATARAGKQLTSVAKTTRFSTYQIKGSNGFFGSRGFELRNAKHQKIRNNPTYIQGRLYGGHALDQMQNRGFTPSIVEEAIQNGVSIQNKISGRMQVYHLENNISVITENDKVVTVMYGRLN